MSRVGDRLTGKESEVLSNVYFANSSLKSRIALTTKASSVEESKFSPTPMRLMSSFAMIERLEVRFKVL